MTTCDASMIMNTNQANKFSLALRAPPLPYRIYGTATAPLSVTDIQCSLEHESGFLAKRDLLQTLCRIMVAC